MRDRFLLPDGPDGPDGPPAIYLAGQSLGLQPRSARVAVEEVLDRWAHLGVDGWFTAERPWFTEDDALREPMARIVGARPAEIAILNSLTVNLHAAPDVVLPAGRPAPPDPRRRAALPIRSARADEPPRRRAGWTRSRTSWSSRHGPARPPSGRTTWRPPSTTTGRTSRWSSSPASTSRPDRLLDIERFTAAGHAAGVTVLWDLAHAAGNVELALHDWGVDAAVWCTYKYLNGGPGSIGAIFVHERFHADATLPRLAGWWGSDAERRFAMDERFVPADGAAGWKASTASMLAMAPLAASLAIFDEVGMPALRSRSVALTGYLADAARRRWSRGHHAARSGRQGRPAVAAVRVGDARRGRARPASPPAGSCPTSGRPISSASRRCRSTRRTTTPGRPPNGCARRWARPADARARSGPAARAGPAAANPGRTCGRCRRTGPAWPGRP